MYELQKKRGTNRTDTTANKKRDDEEKARREATIDAVIEHRLQDVELTEFTRTQASKFVDAISRWRGEPFILNKEEPRIAEWNTNAPFPEEFDIQQLLIALEQPNAMTSSTMTWEDVPYDIGNKVWVAIPGIPTAIFRGAQTEADRTGKIQHIIEEEVLSPVREVEARFNFRMGELPATDTAKEQTTGTALVMVKVNGLTLESVCGHRYFHINL